jgi:hypothetical protein
LIISSKALNPAQNYFHDPIHPDRHPACHLMTASVEVNTASHLMTASVEVNTAFHLKTAFVEVNTASHLKTAFLQAHIAFHLKTAFVEVRTAFHLRMAVVQELISCSHVLVFEYVKDYLSLASLQHQVLRSPAFHDQHYSAW